MGWNRSKRVGEHQVYDIPSQEHEAINGVVTICGNRWSRSGAMPGIEKVRVDVLFGSLGTISRSCVPAIVTRSDGTVESWVRTKNGKTTKSS